MARNNKMFMINITTKYTGNKLSSNLGKQKKPCHCLQS